MKFVFSFYISFLILNFGMVSCGDSNEKSQSEIQTTNNSSTLFGNQKFVFPELSDKAKIYVSNWAVFDDFEKEVKTLNGNTIEVLLNKSELLVSHLDSLSKNIPDTLFNQAILSRVIVVKTRINLLHQELKKSKIDSIQLQNYMNEMNASVSNLIIQINEKFQKDAIDLKRVEDEKKELENQKRFLDSVYKIELQDKKNNEL
ncbi:MAG: hypothetical protein IIB06_02155 [Bacteroidetes bacterium]|nr:hypothetical protein [Bacteroidota bacterium]